MKLSVVTTMYKSQKFIDEFYNRITQSIQNIGIIDYEIIFVDDGSPDDSLSSAIELSKKDIRVLVVELSRNFGHHSAIMEGLSQTHGEYVFLIDIDLEESPELLIEFWKILSDKNSIDVVFGVQKSRKGGFFEKVSGSLFWELFNKLSNVKVTPNILTARLMNRNYVCSLLQYKEKDLFLAGLFQLCGFVQFQVLVDKKDKGSSSYSLGKKIDMFINAITSFSYRPLQLIFTIGVLLFGLSAVIAVYTLIQKIILQIDVPGWTSLMILTSFFAGVNILCIGIIGIYLAKIFVEIKNRPRSIVRSIHKG